MSQMTWSALLVFCAAVAFGPPSIAQDEQIAEHDAGAGCKVRANVAPGSQFVWRGACQSGYADGYGTLLQMRTAADGGQMLFLSRGTFRRGYREGAWEFHSKLPSHRDGEVGYGRNEYQNGKPLNMPSSKVDSASQLPSWAKLLAEPNALELAKSEYAASRNSVATLRQPPAAPTTAATSPAAVGAQPAGSSGAYKGNLYVMRVDVTTLAGGDAGRMDSLFMSAIATDRAAAERLFEDYKRKGAYFATQGYRFDLQVHECNGAGRGPYFALLVEQPDWADERRKLGTKIVAGWTCGAATPEAAAQSALGGCRKYASCSPRPTAHHYLFVSSHYAGGGSRLYDHATYGVREGGTVRAMAFQQNNYDYTGCFWSFGKLVGEGFSTGTRGEPGNGADKIQLSCRSIF